MSGPGIVERNDLFGTTPLLRSRLATTPDYEGLNSLETRTIRQRALGAGATTLYTCPAKRRARTGPGVLFVHNPTGGAITADFYWVPSGGAAGSTNQILPTQTFAAASSQLLFSSSLWHVFMTGEAFVINTGGAGLNVYGHVMEERASIASYLGGFVGNLPASETTLLSLVTSNLGGRTAAVKSIFAYNASAGTRVLTVHARPSGVAAGEGTQILEQSMNTLTAYQLDYATLPTLAEGGLFTALGDNTQLNVWIDCALY